MTQYSLAIVGAIVLFVAIVALAAAGLGAGQQQPYPTQQLHPTQYGIRLNEPTVLDFGHGLICVSFNGGNVSCTYAPDWTP